jgi:hypothetical protein
VIALGQATREQYRRASHFFADYYAPVSTVWMDGERIQNLLRMLEELGLSAGEDGNGRSCWMGIRLFARSGEVQCRRPS